MVLTLKKMGTILLALAASLPALAAEVRDPAEVTLPLAEYLAMVEKAEARQKSQELAAKTREEPIAEVVEERISLRLEEKVVVIESFFELLVRGEPIKPIWLPLAGYGESAILEKQAAGGAFAPAPAAALTAFAGRDGGTVFVTTEPGRYRVRAKSRLVPDTTGGSLRIGLLKVAAPVASAEVDLPADLEWSSPGAVVVGEKVEGGRRQVKLATQRGTVPVVLAKRRFEQGEETALAHTVVLTLFQLRPEGLRRHDVLLYEVSRGQLSKFEVTLPAGLEIEQAATDEGPTLPLAEGGRLRIDRQRQLQGTGYLVLTSTPTAGDELALTQVRPEVETRARFLAVSSSSAAEIGPQPAASFSQVDLEDLPPLLGQALGAVRLAAAWRLTDDKEKGPLSLRLQPLPPAPSIAATVRLRDTMTLLTVDGTLLHRETFTLAPNDRPSSSFEVSLPAGAVLWSTKVGDQAVRPLQRGGKVVLPILPKPGESVRVEVVAVLEQAIAPGRSLLDIELAQVASPVLEHAWRLLLPDGPKYRFAGGELDPVPAARVLSELKSRAARKPMMVPPPAPAAPGLERDQVIDEALAIREELVIVQDGRSKAAREDAVEAEGRLAAANYSAQIGELQQGLVGGVKPLPITIPESGKSLVLTGVLPPERVAVKIEVKAKK